MKFFFICNFQYEKEIVQILAYIVFVLVGRQLLKELIFPLAARLAF